MAQPSRASSIKTESARIEATILVLGRERPHRLVHRGVDVGEARVVECLATWIEQVMPTIS
jgi:hypothetical protein